jgi:hypothetical protein
MNKLFLNTIMAALLTLSMQGVSAQPPGSYSYIGNKIVIPSANLWFTNERAKEKTTL